MLETQLWSLSTSCRRLIEETAALSQDLDSESDKQIREASRLLTYAEDLLAVTLEEHNRKNQLQQPSDTQGVAALTERILLDDGPTPDRKTIDLGEPPSPFHRRSMHSEAFFLPSTELVTFLCGGRKTGVLRIRTDDEVFTIELHDGDIVHAHSDGSPQGDRLGDILIEKGILTPDELISLLRQDTDYPLGARAMAQELASRAELQAALSTQIQRLFQRLFRATPQGFVFWDGPRLRTEDDLRLNSTMLLLNGARAADERRRASQE